MLKVTCAIIISRNEILVTQRSESSDHPLQWEFPGGKVKDDESLTDCLKREIWEELNIEIEIQQKLIPVKYDYGFKQIELFPFLCSVNSGEIRLTEHSDFRWIDFEELKHYDFSAADKKLIEITKNQNILKKYLRENMHDSG